MLTLSPHSYEASLLYVHVRDVLDKHVVVGAVEDR